MTMSISKRAARRSAVMTMKANPPTLTSPVRTKTYLDYESMSQGDIKKCERLIDEFLRTGEIECPTKSLYFKLMIVLREKRRIVSSKGNFTKAGEYDNLIRQISNFFNESNYYKAKAEEVDAAQNELYYSQTRSVEVEDKWTTQLSKMRSQSIRSIKKVNDFCDQQMENYDTKIPDTLPPEYSKLSPELLNMKDRERHMISCRMFKEAEELHKEFAKRQKEELQRHREEYFRSFEISRKLLEKRTNRKRTAIQSDWERKINHTEHMMNKELKPLKSSVNYLQKKVIDAKSEYIGEDDPILYDEKEIYNPRTYDVTNTIRTRGITPKTITRSWKSIRPTTELVTTKQMSATMQRKNRNFDSNRWP